MAITLENKNYIKSHLASTCLIGDDHCHVHAGDGAQFEHPSRAVIWAAAYASPLLDAAREIVQITEITTDNLTITRAQEGTVAKEWAADDHIAHVLTAGKIDEIETEITGNIDQSMKQAASPTFVGVTLSGTTASLPLFTGASKELVSKSVADTQTALGIIPAALKVDGTVGRVLKTFLIIIGNGSTAAHITCTSINIWNAAAEASAESAEFAAGETSSNGFWALGAGDSTLTFLNAAISGNCVAVLSASCSNNQCGTVLQVGFEAYLGIYLTFRNATGAAIVLSTLVDTGSIGVTVTFLTSA